MLSDRGTNLLSHLMKDIYDFLGIKKLNTMAYHPQCDGIVERFNRTLITILRKHADKYGKEWYTCLDYGLIVTRLISRKNTYLLFGWIADHQQKLTYFLLLQLLQNIVGS